MIKKTVVSSAEFAEYGFRMDAKFHASLGKIARKKILNARFKTKPLGNICSRIFKGPRFSRTYVSSRNAGIPFLSSSEIIRPDFPVMHFISKKSTKKLNELLIKEGWILVTRSGTVGNISYVRKDMDNMACTEDVMRLEVKKDSIPKGYLFAFLLGSYGNAILKEGTYGGVVQHIEPEHIIDLPVPVLKDCQMDEIEKHINSAAIKRTQANLIISECRDEVRKNVGLPKLNPNDFEHYGPRTSNRKVACFAVNALSPLTLNAFNYSVRLRKIAKYVYSRGAFSLGDILQPGGFFHTSSFPRIEIDSPSSIKLLGQKELFTLYKKGKQIARIFVPPTDRASYGEVIIAGVGTMGETELFGRAEFVGGELEGELLAGEFIRMNTIDEWHPGYLYAWLSSEYGFRMIRGTEAGTKLCRPIKALLKKIPVPDLPKNTRDSIGSEIERAYQLKNKAREEENLGVKKVEEWMEELMN